MKPSGQLHGPRVGCVRVSFISCCSRRTPKPQNYSGLMTQSLFLTHMKCDGIGPGVPSLRPYHHCQPRSVEKWSSMKPVPCAGDHWNGQPSITCDSFWSMCLPSCCSGGRKTEEQTALNCMVKWNPSILFAPRWPEMVTQPKGHKVR